jgi:hypothetical protein
MISSANQQENNETTSVSSHLKNCSVNGKFNGALLVAPRIHNRVAQYFQFVSSVDKSFMLPVSIKVFSSTVKNNKDIFTFTNNYKSLHKQLMDSSHDIESFVDFVNK